MDFTVTAATAFTIGLVIGWRLARTRRPFHFDVTIHKGKTDDHDDSAR